MSAPTWLILLPAMAVALLAIYLEHHPLDKPHGGFLGSVDFKGGLLLGAATFLVLGFYVGAFAVWCLR